MSASVLVAACDQKAIEPGADDDPVPGITTARVTFTTVARRATGLGADIGIVTFDDGSGARTADVSYPWPVFTTRNSGTLRVRFVVVAPDTLGVGELELPLRKDWEWSVSAYLYDVNPTTESFCINARSFPLRRAVPGADSLYIVWGGAPISEQVAC